MGRSWKDVKADKERIDRELGRDIEASQAKKRDQVQAYVMGCRLSQLREQAGLTQAQVAERMGISQPRVSQLENGDPRELMVATLDRYVAALGGRLRMVVDAGWLHEISAPKVESNRASSEQADPVGTTPAEVDRGQSDRAGGGPHDGLDACA